MRTRDRPRREGGRRAGFRSVDRPTSSASDERPLRLTTGRTVYHWHTRTKTGRVDELDAAAPDVWVELAPADAAPLGIAEGDLVRVESARGAVVGRARLSGIRPGVVFVPFHYGAWRSPDEERHERAANELTITAWERPEDIKLRKILSFAGGAGYNDMRYSAGAGLRIGTPVGPIRVDYGWKIRSDRSPVEPDLSSPRGEFHFSLGHPY